MAGADGLPSNDPVAVAGQFNEQVPHSRDLGMEVVAVETDQIRMRLIPQPWLLADDDAEQICSSVLYSLADSAAGLAVFAAAGALAPIATLDLRMGKTGVRLVLIRSSTFNLSLAPVFHYIPIESCISL